MRPFLFFLTILLCLSGCLQRPVNERVPPRFTVSNRPPVKVDRKKTPYTFGYLEVPENRNSPNGRTIKLPVYIFKSRSTNPAPDPVLYTVGGPGNSSLGAAPYMRAYSYLDDRDLILFEQRGTKHAKPHLSCPEWAKAKAEITRTGLDDTAAEAILAGAAAGCSERLQKQGVDLNAYNTREIAADIEDLRKALKLEQLNLLTLSYSTKIAQVMMRDYPSSIRSVVMDSPLPLAASWDESSLSNLMETYEIIFTDCAADSLCSTQYPKLRERFFDFLTNTAETPISIAVKHPSEDRDTTVSISSADIVGYLGELYTGNVATFPGLLDAVIEGNREIIRDNFSWPYHNGDGIGMRLSVWCSEETAYTSPKRVAEESTRYAFLMGTSAMVFSYEVCRAWGVSSAPPAANQAISSDVPTLLLSGSYDAITPVKWADSLHARLAKSQQLVFPGWTHGVTTYWNNDCAMQAAKVFFNAPQKKVSAPCSTVQPVSFE